MMSLLSRAAAVVAALLLGGCSLIFDGSSYEGGEETDAGTDAGPPPDDAGRDAGDDECSDHYQCYDSPVETEYVCVPRGPGGSFICEDGCEAPEDCDAFGGHPEGAICLPGGDCGCDFAFDCFDPFFNSCDRRTQVCLESNCAGDFDCMPMMTGQFCVEGICQEPPRCLGPDDCSPWPDRPECVLDPSGLFRFCAPFCMSAADCAPPAICIGMPMGNCE